MISKFQVEQSVLAKASISQIVAAQVKWGEADEQDVVAWHLLRCQESLQASELSRPLMTSLNRWCLTDVGQRDPLKHGANQPLGSLKILP